MERDTTGVNRRLFLASAAGLAAVGCGARTQRFNYKLSVTLMANGVERTGYSVIGLELTDASGEFMNYGAAVRRKARGQAAMIDMGAEATPVFALLEGPYAGGRRFFSCTDTPAPVLFGAEAHRNWIGNLDQREPVEAELKGVNRPMLVTFDDPLRRTSVTPLDDAELMERYGATYHRAFVQKTNASVTSGIQLTLPWLNQEWSKFSSRRGPQPDNPFDDEFNYSQFLRATFF